MDAEGLHSPLIIRNLRDVKETEPVERNSAKRAFRRAELAGDGGMRSAFPPYGD
jgi:hypothetical protein